MSSAGPSENPAGALHRFVLRHPLLRRPTGWLSRTVSSAPESSLLRSVLGPMRDRIRGTTRAEDVLRVTSALEAKGLSFHVAGGWGVDALVGRQTRSHDDLDVVIDNYEEDLSRAVEALAPLGFRLVATYERRAWMPKSAVLQGARGRSVDLDSLNWEILAREFGPADARGVDRTSLASRVFAEGTIGGRPVPCLSADVQLLFHALFDLAPQHQHDVRLLENELGAVLTYVPGSEYFPWSE